MSAATTLSVRLLTRAARIGALALAPLASIAGAAVPSSPLVVPAISLQDVYPHDRSLAVQIVRGSVVSLDEFAVGVRAVHLPEHAIVTGLKAFAIDENATLNLDVQLFRRQISVALLDGVELATVSTAGSSGSMQGVGDSSVASPVIDNALYVYWVAARIPADTELFGIQIDFAAPLFLDGFESEDTSAWGPGGVEPGFTSPLVVNFADAISTTLGIDGCWFGGEIGTTDEAYLVGGNVDNGECCFVAPVHLPHGVTVTAMVSYLIDKGAPDLTLSLRRKALANQVVSGAMATVVTSGSSASVRLFADGTVANAVVDNDSYSYFLSSDTCLDVTRHLRYYQTFLFFEE